MKKRLILEVDIVSGEVGWESDGGEFNYFEALGLIETAKAMIITDFMKEEDE